MKTISYLPGFWSSIIRPTCILGGTVSANDQSARVGSQPEGKSFRSPVHQQLDWAVGLEIH
ncbi:hypothetical protein KSC_028590 [Ktedonobacter sp. SOSP1-52]|nr:hypothetical protein KSC_028590 [Ktedonobacter sp. SOSP1-52]